MFLLPRASRLSSRLRPLASQYRTQIQTYNINPWLSRSIQMSAVGYDENTPSSSNATNNSSPNPETETETTTDPSLKPLNDFITNHPLVQFLRQNPSYRESRPHLTMLPSLKPYHFVAGALSGPAKIPLAPYMWFSPTEKQLISIFHIGAELCGHPGFVHGGLLTVMFDEVFARCAMPNFKSGLGVTANLNVDYRAPAAPGEFYVLRARTVGVEGRKAWVEGRMEMLPREEGKESVLVAEGKSLFVEPKFAKSMPSLYKN